jgi:hypothetical protein
MRKQNFIAKAQFHWLRRLMQGKSGQAVVETALLLPVFFLLFVGTIQYAITLFTYCNATYACRNAARYASVRSTSSISPASVAQVKSLVTSGLFLNTAIAPTVAVACHRERELESDDRHSIYVESERLCRDTGFQYDYPLKYFANDFDLYSPKIAGISKENLQL